MNVTRRHFLTSIGAAAGLGFGLTQCRVDPKKPVPIPEISSLSPPFRLPEIWYRKTIGRLQNRLEAEGLDGMIFRDRWNIIYFSGLFHTSTERPFWLFVPTTGDPTLFCPGLDRDLAETWWINDYEWYFDYPHHGRFNQVVYEPGPKVHLFKWMLSGLGERGFSRAALGIEEEVGPSKMTEMRDVLPKATLRAAGDIALRMRQVKTPEEIELTQKAIDLHDQMLAYARTYILEHGTDITDFDVRMSTERYGTELLREKLDLDGRPHNGVGVRLRFGCRAGPATAYPHPNQFFHAGIKRGDAIQIAALIRIGGYGGEGYRALQSHPMSERQKQMWEVHTRQTELQAELCKAGTRCNEVATQVLAVARDAGLEQYIYHRPAHGEGMEGHQAPYLSLGDETLLEEGMMFSNEPGLYNPSEGYGYNHSNNIVVGKERGIRMNKTPMTPDWCWLRL